MNILILGSGGREHAFAWKISQSPKCSNLYVAPGNAGTSQIAENINVSVSDFPAIKNIITNKNIDLVIVGPEVPLVEGIRDYLENDNSLSDLKIVGPGKDGATLEGSKEFAKDFMIRHNIPTAQSMSFTAQTLKEGLQYIESQRLPVVLKADGLAAGKGVIIAEDHDTAKASLKEMLVDSKFGEASSTVVIEDFLDGIELSVFVLTDGKSYKILPEAKDYKRIGEHDSGLNTGGMGAVSPVQFAQEGFLKKVEDKVVKQTIDGLQKDNIDYKGFIFIGLMNVNGEPFVIEYNVRMGDPETQVVFPRIKSDLLELMVATAEGTLENQKFELDDRTATTVVMVSGGYPDSYEKGFPISGLNNSVEHTIVFHAGTKLTPEGQIVNSGGRVLNITGFGEDLGEALDNSYKMVSEISWQDVYYRKDIGQDLMTLSN